MSATTGDGGRTIRAAAAALQRELAASADDPETTAHLLHAADSLLHSAVLEDLRSHRRSAAAADLQNLVERAGKAMGADRPAPSADPFLTLTTLAMDLGGCADGSNCAAVEDILRLVAATDLPELGNRSTAQAESAAAAAMNWLGRGARSDDARDRVGDYLAAHRGEYANVKVRSVTQLAGGFSKITLLVELVHGGRVEEIVVRQVRPGREAGGLAAEFDVLRLAWRHGVPAPEPLWLEADDNEIGGPFFVTRRAAGTNQGDVFGPGPDTEPEVALGLARALATLHTIDPTQVRRTPVPPMVSRAEILARIDEQQVKIENAAGAFGAPSRPLDQLLIGWLRRHAPDQDVRPSLLHGDPGFHNLLVLENHIEAMLDWERSLVGDPAQDLAYVQSHVRRVVDWSAFLDEYRAAGGTAPSGEQLRYYAVWHDTWRYAGSFGGLARLHGERGSVLDAVTGLLHAPRFLLSALRTAFEVDL